MGISPFYFSTTKTVSHSCARKLLYFFVWIFQMYVSSLFEQMLNGKLLEFY